MQSSKNTVTHILPSSTTDQRVEICFEQTDGVEGVALRYSTWTEGLGWCGQKTIRLDPDQLDDLHHALTVARHRVNRKRAETGEHLEPAKVIQLPALG